MTKTIQCRVLRAFGLSLDGITTTPLAVGDEAAVPEEMVEGLFVEGFVTHPDPEAAAVLAAARAAHLGLETPAVTVPVVETTIETPDLETKDADGDDIEALRAQYEAVAGEPADKRWSAETLRTKIIEA